MKILTSMSAKYSCLRRCYEAAKKMHGECRKLKEKCSSKKCNGECEASDNGGGGARQYCTRSVNAISMRSKLMTPVGVKVVVVPFKIAQRTCNQ